MKLAIAIIICTIVYALDMRSVMRAFKTAKTKEERVELQLTPRIIAATALYGTVVYQLISFSVKGVLPLL